MRKVPGLLCFIVILSSLLASSNAFAQNDVFTIIVKDTTKKIFLEGATVRVTLDKAVSAKNTNIQGFCIFNLLPNKRYSITVTYVGYKSKTVNIQKKQGINSLEIIMEEDVTKLNEIIVKAQEILMVVKDDTVKYNINSIRTMEEDDLIEAIKQLPGMTVDEKGVSHMGRPVSRVYVNKTLLFGKNKSQMAYSNLKANEVKNIEVYEEDTDRAKFLGLKEGEKNTVINIVTKEKLVNIINADLSVATGAESQSSDSKYFTSGNFSKFNALRTMSGSLGAKNFSPGFSADKGRENSGNLNVSYTENSIKRIEFGIEGSANFNNSKGNNIIERIYFPSQEYESKKYSENSIPKGSSHTYKGGANLQFTLDTFNIILAAIDINDDNNHNSRVRSGFMEADNEIISRFNNTSHNSNNSNYFSQFLTWSHRFRKPGRSFTVNLMSKNTVNTGEAGQTDTSLQTTNKIRDYKKSQITGSSFTGSFQYGEPLLKGEAGLKYEFVYDKGTNKRDAENLLLNITDSINTYRFSTDKMRQELNMFYRRNTRTFSLNSNSSVFINKNLRDERFPEDYVYSRVFRGANFNFSIRRIFNTKHTINANYSGNTSVPALESLRGVVNNSNPLFLSAGNPDLLSAYNQSAGIRYSYFSENGTTFSFSLDGSNSFNGVTVKKTTFTQDTYIDKYNFTFKKGTTFSTSINVNGIKKANISFNFSKNITALKFIMSGSFGYNYSINPYYSGENLINQVSSGVSLIFQAKSNFSRKFNIDISSDSRKGTIKNGSKGSSGQFSQRVNLDIKAQILKRFGFKSQMMYYYYIKPELNNSKINTLLWNMSLSYKFKKNKGDITLTAKDILNKATRISTSEREDYIQSSYNNDAIKRIVLLSFNYNFRVRK